MSAPVHPRGVCQICSCTAKEPCNLRDGDECAWLDERATLCNNPDCVRTWAKREREARRQKRAARQHPWKVKERDPVTNRPTRIVRNRNYKPKGRAEQ